MKHEHMIVFRLSQIWTLIRFVAAYVVALFYKRRPIWLVTERGVDARDNGYWFFKYLKETHPEVESYYILSKDSPDRERMLSWKRDLLEYKSFRHFVMLWRADYLISSHVQGYFPFAGLGLWLKRVWPSYRHKKHIGLKHGITKDYMPYMDYANTTLDMIVAAVKPEYEYFISKNNYPENHVALTGFARYDNLNDYTPKRQILVMPTWREWIYKKNEFENTEYAQTYMQLLQSESLRNLLETNGVQLVYYPHHEVQKYIHLFLQVSCSNNIIIADEAHYDVQQLLKESAVLVTDYSSVYFDFAYMCKPIVYYQFDLARYRKEHYAEGWFDYNHSFGKVTQTESELLQAIKECIESGFAMKPEYSEYTDSLFPYHDTHNCERIYQAVCDIK